MSSGRTVSMAERVRSGGFGAKKTLHIPFIAKLLIIFFNHHLGPRQSSTIQVRREGRGDNCVKNLSIIIIRIINYNNDKRNKNISIRQTQSPQ